MPISHPLTVSITGPPIVPGKLAHFHGLKSPHLSAVRCGDSAPFKSVFFYSNAWKLTSLLNFQCPSAFGRSPAAEGAWDPPSESRAGAWLAGPGWAAQGFLPRTTVFCFSPHRTRPRSSGSAGGRAQCQAAAAQLVAGVQNLGGGGGGHGRG